MIKYTREDIMRICAEEKIRFIRLQFTDITGSLKNIAITTSQLEKALDKCMYEEKKYVITGRDTGATCSQFGEYVMQTIEAMQN